MALAPSARRGRGRPPTHPGVALLRTLATRQPLRVPFSDPREHYRIVRALWSFARRRGLHMHYKTPGGLPVQFPGGGVVEVWVTRRPARKDSLGSSKGVNP